MVLTVGAVSADLNNWQIKLGLGDNVYPYGNDFSTRLGVDPNGTWDYDARDAVHPPVGDPTNDLAFIYNRRYDLVYTDQGWGWPPPWGNHGGGAQPNYPAPGLLKDTRAPVTGFNEPEYWRVQVQAPKAGEVASFIWELNTEPGFEVPAEIVVKILANEDLAAAGIVGDLVLTDAPAGVNKITGIPQWGLDDNDEPIRHFWVVEASIIPEPAVAQLAGLVFGIAGLGIARFRRK
jgi:hypothetical protein